MAGFRPRPRVVASPSHVAVAPRSAAHGFPRLTAVCAGVPSRSCPSQKWSKGKVKEKLSNLVLFDKTTYEKMLADVPKQKLITPSIISEKLKVNGSLARKAVRELVSKELIRMRHAQAAHPHKATHC